MANCNIIIKQCENNAVAEVSCFDELLQASFYPNGKKHSHQYRIPKSVLERYKKNVGLKEKEILKATTFDELLEIISIASIEGIGDLTRYDIAFRIGQHLDILPQKIYLHAGTKIGAKKLGVVGKSKTFLTAEELPEWLKNIEPYKIEDFLCKYKENPTKGSLIKYLKEN